MAIDFQNPLTAGTVLVRSDVRSQNYVAGSSGWIIEADGDAEFNNLVIRGEFLGTNFELNSDGLFIYDGTPANGNLVASIAPNSGTDSFGNTYLEGINTYAGTEFAGLNVGNLLLGTISDAVHAGLVGLSGADGIFASSPTSGSNTATSTWQLLDGLRSVTPVSASGFPHMQVDGTVWSRDPVLRAFNNANVWSAESWHNPSYNANWSGSATFGTVAGGVRSLQYRFDAEDNLWLNGAFTAAAGAGSSVFQLPAGPPNYRPATNGGIPVAFISSGGVAGNAWMYVSAAGNLNINSQFGSAVTAGTTYYVNGKIPLGTIA